VCIKTNADEGVLEGALLYEKRAVDLCIDGYDFTVARSVHVGEAKTITKDDVFKQQHSTRGEERREASAFLKRVLADGAVAADEVKRLAVEDEISWGTLKRASEDLGVVKRPDGFQGPYLWSLPQGGAQGGALANVHFSGDSVHFSGEAA